MSISFNDFIDVITNYSSMFLMGIKTTLLLSLIGVACGIVLGLILTFFRLSKSKVLRGISKVYLEIIRGTPLMVQVFFVFMATPELTGIKLSPFTAGAIAMSINSAAYVSEIMRSGINSIDKGQMEASRSLGLGYSKTMRYVIIPQATKNILPTLGNEFISIIKETSTLTVIGVTEIMFATKRVQSITYKATPTIIVAAILYFAITFTLSRVIAAIERRMSVSD